MLPIMTLFDAVACLGALTVKELYDPSLLRALIARLFASCVELNEKDCVLSLTALDRPHLATELLVSYEDHRQSIRDAYASRRLTQSS